jgi:hypothetical protein
MRDAKPLADSAGGFLLRLIFAQPLRSTMLSFSNFARLMHEISAYDMREHPAPPDRRGSLVITLIPVALIVAWAAVLLKH